MRVKGQRGKYQSILLSPLAVNTLYNVNFAWTTRVQNEGFPFRSLPINALYNRILRLGTRF